MREQLVDTCLQNTISFTLRQTLLVVCRDQQYGHVLRAELADELATDATRRYGRAHVPADPMSVWRQEEGEDGDALRCDS